MKPFAGRGVSAGSSIGCSYISGQRGRNLGTSRTEKNVSQLGGLYELGLSVGADVAQQLSWET